MNANSLGRNVHRLLAVPEEVVREFQRRQELQSDQSVNDLVSAERRLAAAPAATGAEDENLSAEERKTQIASLLERLSIAQQKFASLYKNEGVISAPGDIQQEPALSESNYATTAETFVEKPKPIAALFQKVEDNLVEEKKALDQAPPPARKRQRTTVDTQLPSSSSLIPINSQQSPALIPINYPHMIPSTSSSTAAAPITESKQPMAKSRSNFEAWTPQRLARDRQPPNRLGKYAPPEVRKKKKKVDWR
uniref:Uncharacterized protein n=1 Tax=Plectus sambesii TaxID=2011161 RepID=A0A914X4Q4_9BILA